MDATTDPWTLRLTFASWLQSVLVYPSLVLLPGYHEAGSAGQAFACLGGYVVMVVLTTRAAIRYHRNRTRDVAQEGCLLFYLAPGWLLGAGLPLWVVTVFCVLPTANLVQILRMREGDTDTGP